MVDSHLSHDEFFTQLASLLEKTQKKGHGSVFLTQKRLTFDLTNTPTPASKIPDDPLWDLNPPDPLPILIRATDGISQRKDRESKTTKRNVKEESGHAGRIKLGTVVRPDELEAFFARYADVCKAGMQSLKKRDRSKRKKDKKGKKKG